MSNKLQQAIISVVVWAVLLIGTGLLTSGCGAEVRQEQDARAELVVHYPEMARCFDLYEADKLTAKQFQHCIETASNHTITIDADGIVTQIEAEELIPQDT